MEVQQYSGKCKCGNKLDIRIVKIEKEADPKKETVSWGINGYCKKCGNIYVQGLFFQEEKPIQDRDFTIDWNKQVKK